MTCRPKVNIIGSLLAILFVASVGSRSANAQAKLDAYYTATLLGLPIGHISWTVDLKESRFTSVATGSIAAPESTPVQTAGDGSAALAFFLNGPRHETP
jgi:hypothetical protein